ncbi:MULTISPECIES: cupin domain-containing protein [unclassified Sinorhizobium]|uniref:cupin domain-containing protein n=1 Tax=unclassified Sinorhizobium TaxID=2613772 RepID=UPI0024C2944D|nr:MULTISPECIES: cupin domain-containing protein [unclassified Sinorhizobium]MDK1373784.1 cupin domain-containing protein [Sinorhizobium sp. 6-70]MDK1481820.1 cupin domain-containing protein [Sinorhizobium sp. 6-117]
MKTTRIMAAALLIVGGGWTLNVAEAQQPGIHRTDVLKDDLGTPGREAVQVRVDIERGVASIKHAHPGEEIAYVLEGSLEYRLEGRAPVILHAGEALFIPDGVAHVARNVGSGKASELATYIVDKGEPLVVPVK